MTLSVICPCWIMQSCRRHRSLTSVDQRTRDWTVSHRLLLSWIIFRDVLHKNFDCLVRWKIRLCLSLFMICCSTFFADSWTFFYYSRMKEKSIRMRKAAKIVWVNFQSVTTFSLSHETTNFPFDGSCGFNLRTNWHSKHCEIYGLSHNI